MAGLGFKDFAVGEVLTSADVDGYLMQQSVMRFADAAARGSALGTATGTGVPLAEGMVAYLDDANRIEVFDGTVWRPSGAVLAVGTAANTTTTTLSGTYADISISVTVNPVSANSFFVIEWEGILTQGSGGAGSGDASARILDGDDTVLVEVTEAQSSDAGGHSFNAVMLVRALKSYGNTTSRTFRVQAKHGATNGTATNRNMVVWEIES